MDVIYTLIDKPTRTLVPAHCKGVNERLGPEFEVWAKTWKFEKTEGWGIVKFKKWSKNIAENMLEKKLLLRKCHVRFIHHFALAAEGYIWDKGIILLFRFHSGSWEVDFTSDIRKIFFFWEIILGRRKNWRTNNKYAVPFL